MNPPVNTERKTGSALEVRTESAARAAGAPRLHARAWQIAGLYALFATLWIYFSDTALELLLRDPALMIKWSVYKGLGFVIITSLLLLVLMSQAFGTIASGYSALQKTERRLRASEERLASIIGTAMDAVVTLDESRRIVLFNAAAEKMFGYERGEALDQSIDRLVPEGLDPAKGSSFVVTGLRRDGSQFPVEASISQFESGGRTLLTVILRDISLREKAEQTLRHERDFSEALIASLPGVLYLYDQSGRFVRWNENFERATGYTAAEIAAMHPLDFFDGADREFITARIGQVFETGSSSAEAIFVAKDGSRTPYHFTGVRTQIDDQTCLVGVGIDITERKRADELVTESERKYRELVELANSIILRWNSEGRITFLNEFGQTFFGYTAEEILGRHVMGSIVPATDASGRDLQSLMESICADPKAFEQNVNENVRRNGERVDIAWTNRIVRDDQGQVVEILSVGTDITERRRAEQAIRELNATLEHRVAERTAELAVARDRAESADKIKSAFLANMSHELRTPLNSIIGFTGIVLQGLAGPLNEEQTKQLGMVRGSARHLLELINDVLDISKIEAGQLEVRSEPVDVRASVERVTASVKPLADKKGLALSAVVADGVDTIQSDRRRVEQILLNLLNNAIKFTDHGSVTLKVEVLPQFRVSEDGRMESAVRFQVADTGIGISAADLANLFQPFRQLDHGLARQHEGTGLGLAICRRLATLLHGHITASSTGVGGSEFTVILPVQKSLPP